MEEKEGFWDRLSDRERRLLVVWAAAMAFIVVFLGGYFAYSAIATKQESADRYAEAVSLITKEQSNYLKRKSDGGKPLSERIEKNQLKLQTFLETEASKYNLKIENFNGSKLPVGGKKKKDDDKGPRIVEETVAIDIRNTEYSSVVSFLDALERTEELLVIKRIDVSRSKRSKDAKVKISLTVSTFKLENDS